MTLEGAETPVSLPSAVARAGSVGRLRPEVRLVGAGWAAAASGAAAGGRSGWWGRGSGRVSSWRSHGASEADWVVPGAGRGVKDGPCGERGACGPWGACGPRSVCGAWGPWGPGVPCRVCGGWGPTGRLPGGPDGGRWRPARPAAGATGAGGREASGKPAAGAAGREASGKPAAGAAGREASGKPAAGAAGRVLGKAGVVPAAVPQPEAFEGRWAGGGWDLTGAGWSAGR